MARRLIGLDIGTNAVSVAEVAPGSPPRLTAFGQVALPRDAMREGEVVDEAAVSEAVTRLRSEVKLPRAAVRVGIASPRLIVRQVELPVMSRDELQGALRFQAQDLIPIPLEEAVLDFAILGTDTEGEEPTMRVLLAAAQEATVARLVGAVEAGGLAVGAVDLIPLALIRSLARPAVEEEEAGAEGIVSFGGGVTCVAVHEAGIPRFVRVLGVGGRQLTDAIATDLALPPETAESIKRQIGQGPEEGATEPDELVTRAAAAVERPLGVLLDEVRSSLDYFRNQPGATRLLRVVVTGGAALLPEIDTRLAALVGVPVEPARPRDLLVVGEIGFAEEDLPRLDPYLPASVGLALGGAGIGTVIDLSPSGRRRVGPSRVRVVGAALVAAALVAVLLAYPTMQRNEELADKRSELEKQQATNAVLDSQIAELSEARAKQSQLDVLRAQFASLLATDVSWARMLQEIAKTIPNDVWLTSFKGQVTQTAATPLTPTVPTTQVPGATTTTAPTATTGGTDATTPTTPTTVAPAPGGTLSGTVTWDAVGLEYPSVAAWLQRISQIPSFGTLWVPQAALNSMDTRDVVNFTSTATVTSEARSDRLERYTEGAQ